MVAGLPAIKTFSVRNFLLTTVFAPTILPFGTIVPFKMMERVPIHTLLPIKIGACDKLVACILWNSSFRIGMTDRQIE